LILPIEAIGEDITVNRKIYNSQKALSKKIMPFALRHHKYGKPGVIFLQWKTINNISQPAGYAANTTDVIWVVGL